jgi:hypothetical protein
VLASAALASAALALSLPTVAAAAPLPRATTVGVTRVHGTSVELTGSVNPEGSPTTFYFQFGPTAAYGRRTASGNAGNGISSLKVGAVAAPFVIGYHFRLVATNAAGTTVGNDRIYIPRRLKFKFVVARDQTVPWGSRVVVSGLLSGLGGGHRPVALLASPFPYKEAFEQIGRPVFTSATGRFSFRLGVLSRSTQFRLETVEPFPHVSKVFSVHIAVRVSFKVRNSGRPGFVRLYGTVTPREVGVRVDFQIQKEVRPGLTEKTEERTTRFVTQGTTTTRRATKRFSRFSFIVALRHGGLYRAAVLLARGPLVGGVSRNIVIHAPHAQRRRPLRLRH